MAATSIGRNRSPLAVLLDPNTDIPLGERDIRVEDYLNDKIQTNTDLESLKSLVASVEAQKEQLEDQVCIKQGRGILSPRLNPHSSKMPDKSSRQPKASLRIACRQCSSKPKNLSDSKLVCTNA